MDNKPRLEIAEILRYVQSELIKSENERKLQGLPPLFHTERCEIELKCVIEKTVSKGGKVDFKLLAINLGDNVSHQVIHTIKVSFLVPENLESTHEDAMEYDRPTGLRPRKK